MGRIPRCTKDGLNKGAWTALEDEMLVDYVKSHGEGKWSNLAKETGERDPIHFLIFQTHFNFLFIYLFYE